MKILILSVENFDTTCLIVEEKVYSQFLWNYSIEIDFKMAQRVTYRRRNPCMFISKYDQDY